jgi:hypothetical protein
LSEASRVLSLLGGALAAMPVAASAQQSKIPTIGFLNSGSTSGMAFFVTAFRNGLKDADWSCCAS